MRFDVLALDFRGHGGSDHGADGRYGFDDYVGDVLAVLTALGGPPPLVIGHSMGGYIAARLAARHPARIAGVVITDILTAWPDDFAKFARRQAERPAMAFASVAAAGERFKLVPPIPARRPSACGIWARLAWSRGRPVTGRTLSTAASSSTRRSIPGRSSRRSRCPCSSWTASTARS